MNQKKLKRSKPEQKAEDPYDLKLENFVYGDTPSPRPEKYKDPLHIWDSIDEKTEFLYIHYLNKIKKSGKLLINDIYHQHPNATLINLFEFPPNSVENLRDFPKNLTNLKMFVIYSNSIKSIQGFPKDLPNLKILNLKSSQISDLTPLPENLPSLERFFISKCKIISLKGIPKDLPKLDRFFVDSIPIKTLEGIPSILPNLTHLKIKNNPIKSLKYLPKSLPSVEKIEISGTDITNLQFMPQHMPKLKEMILTHNHLITLKGMPPNLPSLTNLNLRNNSLAHLKHLPKVGHIGCIINLKDNSIRTLHGLDDRFLKQLLHMAKNFNLCPQGLNLIKDLRLRHITLEKVNEVKNFYTKSSHELAQQYVTNIKSLNDCEIDRLIWEADLTDRKLVENNVPPENLVLSAISQRLKIPFNSDFSLLK
ncbi:leucine-rich repeat domain-containing protein [Promethearchaeum syntrophicum]|uniref:Leucine-rich repeat domain-containing protein n=1 Tax=Promethearchaeum syntrophicum TaxID=2594042 RepID=A0A5B9DAB8_9ARCH|nr:leucine-rich repeat domain-containing protein [Candidatus Prometheoarchaeum syntrophicum]QEE15797.1 Leucine Rich repeats (2 copies) [Candidatus Prometheoarchaeum syntrophicum]